jgi:glucose-6-phosphate 1-dehydrogenase
VIFGVTGDLARTMTFRALYRLEVAGALQCPIIGVAIDDWPEARVVASIRESLETGDEAIEDDAFARLVERFTYVRGDFAEPQTYRKLAEHLKNRLRPLFYLEIPPALFAVVVQALGRAGLSERATVMVEKPFGHDLTSAKALNHELHQVLTEAQILRIDHFLGKQPVLDIHYLRFANALLEPVWNRDHVAALQVSMTEDIGVEDRGAFYDSVGALRDVVQNHLMQVLALIAMEPPVGPGREALWDKKTEVFKAMTDADPACSVRGQYDGYQKVKGVKPGSVTETYVALRLEINNSRWAGVPVFIRAGKALTARATEVRVIFNRPPRLPFLDQPHHTPANQLVFRIDPDPGLRLDLLSKGPDGRASRNVHMDLSFAAELGAPPEPYERLLHDALTGDHSLFTREDTVEATWRVLQPLVDHPAPVVRYPLGSWGPADADQLLRGHPPWQSPWLGDGGE